jgi:O-antigen ligase
MLRLELINCIICLPHKSMPTNTSLFCTRFVFLTLCFLVCNPLPLVSPWPYSAALYPWPMPSWLWLISICLFFFFFIVWSNGQARMHASRYLCFPPSPFLTCIFLLPSYTRMLQKATDCLYIWVGCGVCPHGYGNISMCIYTSSSSNHIETSVLEQVDVNMLQGIAYPARVTTVWVLLQHERLHK